MIGELELAGLGDGDPLAMRVDDEDHAGQALHLADAAECVAEVVHLLDELGNFLLGEPLEIAAGLAASSWSSRAMRFLIVTKLVSMPPSQRG